MILLLSLGIIQQDKLTRAGLMLVGKEAAIRGEVLGYVWTYLKMKNDTEYIDRLDIHGVLFRWPSIASWIGS